jgi:hypothetical protein
MTVKTSVNTDSFYGLFNDAVGANNILRHILGSKLKCKSLYNVS